MEAICSSETSVDTQRTTRSYIPEDGTLHNNRCENLKSYIGGNVIENGEQIRILKETIVTVPDETAEILSQVRSDSKKFETSVFASLPDT
jgi:hypothetical protein